MSGRGRNARSRLLRDVDGILLLDKPEGISSNAALQRVRRAFRARKAGHTGSLDPLASGLLPVCLGQATKASAMLLDADKAYCFRLALGRSTTTGDREGETGEVAGVPDLDEAAVRAHVGAFVGDSMQVPPMYSALKHEGERLYRLARAGVEVERPPRRVHISRLALTGSGPGWLDFEVACSKGTYIRTLAEDIARALGTVGHVASLRRTGLGPFTGMPMHELDRLEAEAAAGADLDGLLVAVDEALPGLPAVQLGAAEQDSVLQGRAVPAQGPGASQVRMYGADGRFLGVGRMSAEGARLAPERIMVRLPERAVSRA
ncbi:MAG TPA: tRNA pseudouridine(55) synthase TruB [Steroidobacteraceae bacterium]|nr:tRNA pseudouridine(55) synthase TruB [Steroidobacteraceae bacterium]